MQDTTTSVSSVSLQLSLSPQAASASLNTCGGGSAVTAKVQAPNRSMRQPVSWRMTLLLVATSHTQLGLFSLPLSALYDFLTPAEEPG
jgi:hypothetical protein